MFDELVKCHSRQALRMTFIRTLNELFMMCAGIQKAQRSEKPQARSYQRLRESLWLCKSLVTFSIYFDQYYINPSISVFCRFS